jgi:hypothetical protein
VIRTLLGSVARRVLPRQIILAYRNYRLANLATEEVFTGIYTRNEWGGRPGEFHSGAGSVQHAITVPYVTHILRKLELLNARELRAVDLGCGDFRIGRQLALACGSYVGVDIVKSLIEHHKAAYGSDRVSFEHVNIIEDNLPPGNICFVRQVFQHLSNAQILAVLPKLNQYRWCFITEHHPSAGWLREPNLDKPHGRDIRVTAGSGVFLDEPPFNIAKDRYRLLFEVPGITDLGGGDAGVIRTYLFSSEQTRPSDNGRFSAKGAQTRSK